MATPNAASVGPAARTSRSRAPPLTTKPTVTGWFAARVVRSERLASHAPVRGVAAGGAAGGAVDAMRARATNPERRRVAFSIAAIALAAKMASADGNASAAEFAT